MVRLDYGNASMNTEIVNKPRDLLFNLAMAPVVWIATVLVGALAGFDMEKMWVFPAVLAGGYPLLKYAGLSMKAVLIGIPLVIIVAVGSNLRAILLADDATIVSPVTVFVTLVVTLLVELAIVAALYYLLNRLRTLLAARIPFAAIALVVIGYGLVVGAMLLVDKPYYGYWIKTYERRLSMAISYGWNDRVRSMATYLAKRKSLAGDLCYATRINNVEAVKILLEVGTDPFEKDRTIPPRNTIECAFEGGSLEAFKVVFEAVPKDKQGELIWVAADSSNWWETKSEDSDSARARLLEFVLDRFPADTVRTLKDNEGNTLLHVATSNCCAGPEQIKLLLQRGADPTATNKRGQTPLDNSKALLDKLRKEPKESASKRRAEAAAEALRQSVAARK